MRTIEEIKNNCEIEPGDKEGQEHWIWNGAYTLSPNGKHRTPMVWSMDLGKGVMRTQSVPRALLQMKTGMPIKASATPRQMCTVQGCVHPDCWKLMTNRQYGAWQRKTGFLAGRPVYLVSSKKTWDKRGRKVSPEAARIMAMSNLKGRELAEMFNIDESTANKYKAGSLGRSNRLGIFAGLLR